jgi:hypothetical protein
MTKQAEYKTETVKVLRSEERGRGAGQIITSTDAVRAGLPQNCVVIPMRILKEPEPIKRHK